MSFLKNLRSWPWRSLGKWCGISLLILLAVSVVCLNLHIRHYRELPYPNTFLPALSGSLYTSLKFKELSSKLPSSEINRLIKDMAPEKQKLVRDTLGQALQDVAPGFQYMKSVGTDVYQKMLQLADSSNEKFQSSILFNLSFAHLIRREVGKCLARLQTALVRDADNERARYNWELLQQRSSEGRASKKSGQPKKGKKGDLLREKQKQEQTKGNASAEEDEAGW